MRIRLSDSELYDEIYTVENSQDLKRVLRDSAEAKSCSLFVRVENSWCDLPYSLDSSQADNMIYCQRLYNKIYGAMEFYQGKGDETFPGELSITIDGVPYINE